MLKAALIALLVTWAMTGVANAACPVTYTFTNGTTADANQVNQNFSDLAGCIGTAYSTGTWTPSLFDGSTLGISYSAQVGFYSKICGGGNKCTVLARFRILVSSLAHPGASSQGAFIQGLPFNISSSATGAYQHLSLEREKGVTGITDGVTGQVYGAAFTANPTLFYLQSDQTSLIANSYTAATVLEGELIYDCDP